MTRASDPYERKIAKDTVVFPYYEITELLALIDGARIAAELEDHPLFLDDIDWQLIAKTRRRLDNRARVVEKRVEQHLARKRDT